MYIPLKQENCCSYKNIYTPKRNSNRKTTISSNFPTSLTLQTSHLASTIPTHRFRMEGEDLKNPSFGWRLGPNKPRGPLEIHQIHQKCHQIHPIIFIKIIRLSSRVLRIFVGFPQKICGHSHLITSDLDRLLNLDVRSRLAGWPVEKVTRARRVTFFMMLAA